MRGHLARQRAGPCEDPAGIQSDLRLPVAASVETQRRRTVSEETSILTTVLSRPNRTRPPPMHKACSESTTPKKNEERKRKSRALRAAAPAHARGAGPRRAKSRQGPGEEGALAGGTVSHVAAQGVLRADFENGDGSTHSDEPNGNSQFLARFGSTCWCRNPP